MINPEETPILSQKGQIAMPYTWWVGNVGSRFLAALRDDAKILGNSCEHCGKVYVPPRKNCGYCFTEMTKWVELSEEGIVIAFTVVHFSFPLHPCQSPFAYALIKLDGADVGFMHVIRDHPEKLSHNVRVKARFRDRALRVGHILDIDAFEII